MDYSTPGFPVLHYLPELAQTHVHWVGVMLSNHLILCHPLLLLPSVFPSIRVFSNESALCIRWPKYYSFSKSPSSEYSGLSSFRIDWFDLFAVQGTLKSLLQHHNSKSSILWPSAFFMVQLSNLYVTTGKAIALTRWTFVGKSFGILQQFGKILSDGVLKYCLILTLFPQSGSLRHTNIHTHVFIYVYTYIYIYQYICMYHVQIYIITSQSFYLPATLFFSPFLCFSFGCILGDVFSLSSIHGFNSVFGFVYFALYQ